MGFPYITLTTSTIGGSTVAYSANDVIGGLLSVSPVPNQGIIQSITITAKSTVNAQVDVMTFASSMSNTTFADNGAIAISSQDFADCRPVIPVSNWSYGGTGCTVGSAYGLNCAYAAGGGERNTLFFTLVARAALIVNSTSDFLVSVTFVS